MSIPPQTMYLDPTDDNARRLFQRGIEGPAVDAEPAPGAPPAIDMFDTRSLCSPRAAGRSSSMAREVTPTSARPMSDALNPPEFDPWTLVDAPWTPKRPASVTPENESDA